MWAAQGLQGCALRRRMRAFEPHIWRCHVPDWPSWSQCAEREQSAVPKSLDVGDH